MSLKQEFQDISAKVKAAYSWTWSAEQQKKFYGLYKQATEGDMPQSTPQPSVINYFDYCKWQGWKDARGKSPKTAMQEYVDYAKSVGF